MNAADMTYYIAKAGDVIKGSGKGTMKTGAAVIIAGAIIVGGAIGIGATKLTEKIKNRKK
jgi:hypothetical protein